MINRLINIPDVPFRRPTTVSTAGKLMIALFLATLPALAQQPSSGQQSSTQPQPGAQQSPAAQNGKKDQNTPNGAEHSGTSNDRLFYTLPNFLTVQDASLPPLTTGQKFKVVARSSFDYVEYPWYGALAGISQAENSEPGYGQGAEGYGKRYGAAFADGTIENFMVGAVVPSLLHQDPRFYQSSSGGFGHRLGYAVSRIFVTRTDSGCSEFNFSEILGSAASASISTYSYHPAGDRTLSNTASVWGSQIGWDTVTIVVKEFWPDIHRKFQKSKDAETAP